MAESVIIHFKNANWHQLSVFILSFAQKSPELDSLTPYQWNYPNNSDPTLSIYEYDDVINEIEDDNIERLYSIWGELPSASLCIELRRSKQNIACDHVTEVCIKLLQEFIGRVDDGCTNIWTLEEIIQGVTKDNGSFMECYRYVESNPSESHSLSELYVETEAVIISCWATSEGLPAWEDSDMTWHYWIYEYEYYVPGTNEVKKHQETVKFIASAFGKWFLIYPEGFRFPIRYNRNSPTEHIRLNNFDFDWKDV